MNSVYILMMFIWFIGWLYAAAFSWSYKKSGDTGFEIAFNVMLILIWPIYLGYTRDR